VDASPSGELDTVPSEEFSSVVDSCTLCDMCYMTKCPYVPPHSFNVDFPHLMLRYRVVERQQGKKSFVQDQLSQTDRNGTLARLVAPIANWVTKTDNTLTRPILEKTLGIHRDAAIPTFSGKTLVKQHKESPLPPNPKGLAAGKKALIYATCLGNYNKPELGLAARSVLAHYGVEVKIEYPGCCGMPVLEQGDLENVSKKAQFVSKALSSFIDEGYDILALVPSCALMLKQEWPLIMPEDPLVEKLAQNTYDISEYVVKLHKEYGSAEGLRSIGEDITVHLSCHSRAQNMGKKAVEMLSMIPGTTVRFIERCSGHGGSWGMMVDHFETALKVGKPAIQQAKTMGNRLVLSECPLAGEHLIQGLERLEQKEEGQRGEGGNVQFTTAHPIEILAWAYGLMSFQHETLP
jgi:glycerol-3-phosphate dehydrogenase subunit C